ncbi:polysaccharide deacetylase family protein [Pseudomonas tensinigenes]|uniref:Polysaccharide deacetylase family protein n=1 Tax=Pseudomonas tensinigenes TaxID=2745511 RepID=A0ABX8PUX2_9PSED|nr:polysaccharide deacetylase family protein [Pseudomonas tensinigenes]QXI05055.1 polysaccharide deacetylase family protein [Pseudomonas tensinigenes]
MPESVNNPAVLLVLHDVAPSTWADYQPFVEAVDAMGNVPMTWLVVPDFHRHNALDDHPAFCQMLDTRVALGDELALHGYFHDDQEPGPTTPRDWFMRRVYTHEGEFYRLTRETALARLRAGIEIFQHRDWPLHGFVAPAWLMSDGTRQALRELPLRYTSDPQHLYRLPDFSPLDAPGLVWSARSAWRRGLSKIVSEQRQLRWRQAPVIRLGLHPVDMRHGYSRNYWLHTLERLLSEGRVPMSKIHWLDQQRGQWGRVA